MARSRDGSVDLTACSHERTRGSIHRDASRALARLSPLAVLVASILLFGCPRSGRGASSPDFERQSDAEYDVARDLFMSRHDPRGALAHAEKAIELNDQNADAYHFVGLVYLFFCSSSPLDCRLPEAEQAVRRALKLRADF